MPPLGTRGRHWKDIQKTHADGAAMKQRYPASGTRWSHVTDRMDEQIQLICHGRIIESSFAFHVCDIQVSEVPHRGVINGVMQTRIRVCQNNSEIYLLVLIEDYLFLLIRVVTMWRYRRKCRFHDWSFVIL
jgi:hypothetical protein